MEYLKSKMKTKIGTLDKHIDNKKADDLLINLLCQKYNTTPEKLIFEEIALPKRNINWKLNGREIGSIFLGLCILGAVVGVVIGGYFIRRILSSLTYGAVAGIILALIMILGRFYYKEGDTLTFGRHSPQKTKRFIVYKKS
jgi:type IV secretory pathway VirB6-like protein